MKDIFEIEQNAIVIREPDLNAIVLTLLAKRMDQYPQSIEEDESLLKTELGNRHRMAIEVRLGEKRILQRAREKVNSWVAALPAHYATGFKRRRIDED
jgi:Rubisco LSMT substrate-binding